MWAARLTIKNFRGIKAASILLPKHGVLIGDNNTGKTTILEALDLVLGPDRLNRQPVIDEHDFFLGTYLSQEAPPAEAATGGGHQEGDGDPELPENPRIEIEVTIVGLNEEQKAKFGDYVEFWDSTTNSFYTQPDPGGVDATNILEALRVTFWGWYDPAEDDFEGATYFTRSIVEDLTPAYFSKRDKQSCGFLYLRTVRTGSRALSLERGSLLDIILRLKEVRPKMWEATLKELSSIDVASDPSLGISPVLESINSALKKYVPKEWGIQPHLKVSNLTREHLRKVITAFIATGEDAHAAPFYRQGTGTINMLVLAMLSQIAADKQNVIFAMEEPETAIPPYAQKRIVHEVRKLASQTLFTSHSPYVLEEFTSENTVILSRDASGLLQKQTITLPDNVKLKRYRQEFRTRFCEGLLARRILVAEGATEASAFPAACRRLEELDPSKYSSLEALGICTVDAGSESNIAGMAELYRKLGKQTFAICDRQEEANRASIEAEVEKLLMHDEANIEAMVIKGTTEAALKRFAAITEWPPHITKTFPDPVAQAADAVREYFKSAKGIGAIADFFVQCSEAEIPQWVRDAAVELKNACTMGLPPEETAQEHPAADQPTPPPLDETE
jgi:putative ATP-dependent endonuclease of OLD family